MSTFNIKDPVFGRHKFILGIEWVWWGKSQKHKWRRFNDHMDMGRLSAYNLPQKGIGRLFWMIVAFLIKPMRNHYHKKYVNSKPLSDSFEYLGDPKDF